MDPIKPINPKEKDILSDKEFLDAVSIGRPRKHHNEGPIHLHNKNILEYIEKNYKDTPLYENLRLITHLHDAGKFAFLEDRQNEYLPTLPERESKKLISESKKFREKYYPEEKVPENLKKYKHTSTHAYASYNFAKKFLVDDKILNIIKYHDFASDVLHDHQQTNQYDEPLFRQVFSGIDLPLYQAFLKCDSCTRDDKVSDWFQTQLKRNNLIK